MDKSIFRTEAKVYMDGINQNLTQQQVDNCMDGKTKKTTKSLEGDYRQRFEFSDGSAIVTMNDKWGYGIHRHHLDHLKDRHDGCDYEFMLFGMYLTEPRPES